MVEKTAQPLRFFGRAIRAVLGWGALALGLFMLWGWIGSSIPRNSGAAPAATEGGVTVLLATNDIHTELILPVVSEHKDWRTTFPSAREVFDGKPVTHIGIGWGDREVFLENPTWGDLQADTVWRIATEGGPGVVRIDHLHAPKAGPKKRPIRLTAAQYRALIATIESELAPLSDGESRQPIKGFREQDRFYEASGEYTLSNTCNQWTTDRLADAGVETGYWTPFAGGVMKWVDEPNS